MHNSTEKNLFQHVFEYKIWKLPIKIVNLWQIINNLKARHIMKVQKSEKQNYVRDAKRKIINNFSSNPDLDVNDLDICLPRYFDSLWEKYSSFEVDDWSQFEDDFYWECVFRLGLMHG